MVTRVCGAGWVLVGAVALGEEMFLVHVSRCLCVYIFAHVSSERGGRYTNIQASARSHSHTAIVVSLPAFFSLFFLLFCCCCVLARARVFRTREIASAARPLKKDKEKRKTRSNVYVVYVVHSAHTEHATHKKTCSHAHMLFVRGGHRSRHGAVRSE